MKALQDFETAPKDGKFLALSKYGIVMTCRWDDDLERFVTFRHNAQAQYGDALQDVRGWWPYPISDE